MEPSPPVTVVRPPVVGPAVPACPPPQFVIGNTTDTPLLVAAAEEGGEPTAVATGVTLRVGRAHEWSKSE